MDKSSTDKFKNNKEQSNLRKGYVEIPKDPLAELNEFNKSYLDMLEYTQGLIEERDIWKAKYKKERNFRKAERHRFVNDIKALTNTLKEERKFFYSRIIFHTMNKIQDIGETMG